MAPQRDDSGCAALVARIAELIGVFDLLGQHDTMSIKIVFQDGRVIVVDVRVRSFPAAKSCGPSLSASSNDARDLDNLDHTVATRRYAAPLSTSSNDARDLDLLDNAVAMRKYPAPLSVSSNEVRKLVNQATARRGVGPIEYGDVTFHLKNGNLEWYAVTLKFRPDEEERVEVTCGA